MSRATRLGLALGTIWAVVAIAVYLAMRKGILPPPKGVGLIDAVLAALYAPFVGAIGLEALARRASPSFGEVVVLTFIVATLVALAFAHAGSWLARAVRRQVQIVRPAVPRRGNTGDMRRVVLVAFAALALAAVTVAVSSSSPSEPLILTRQEAIARAAAGASVNGEPAWTRVESKLVTYGELRPFLLTPSMGPDATDPAALLWVVAYRGRLPEIESGTYQCGWVIRAFAADDRLLPTWTASLCGQGHWEWRFDLLPDRSWWRLDPLGER